MELEEPFERGVNRFRLVEYFEAKLQSVSLE
jgi:hypothetical protein